MDRPKACLVCRNSFAFAAEGGDSSSPLPKALAISYQASPRRPQRRPVHAFEPGIVFGSKVETKKIYSEREEIHTIRYSTIFEPPLS
jgi:hypothetical protein